MARRRGRPRTTAARVCVVHPDIVVANDHDVVAAHLHPYLQIGEFADVGPAQHGVPVIKFVPNPGPSLEGIVGASHLGGDAESPAEVSGQVGAASDEVDGSCSGGEGAVVPRRRVSHIGL